jgi:hypothetical protein
MTETQEWDEHGRHLTFWSVSAATWVLENPGYAYELMLRAPIKDPAAEVATTRNIKEVQVQGLDHAIAAAHELLDKHANQVGEFGLELYLIPPQPPHPDEERLGIRHHKVSAEARKQARALRLRGNLELRLSRLVRYAVPFEHKIANLRFRGIALRVEDDTISWVGLVIPPRRRRRRKPK